MLFNKRSSNKRNHQTSTTPATAKSRPQVNFNGSSTSENYGHLLQPPNYNSLRRPLANFFDFSDAFSHALQPSTKTITDKDDTMETGDHPVSIFTRNLCRGGGGGAASKRMNGGHLSRHHHHHHYHQQQQQHRQQKHHHRRQHQLEEEQNEEFHHLIKKELLNFCYNTAIRGIPRIVKAKSRNMRVIWIAFECMLFIGCLVSMILLMQQYLDYNVLHPPVVQLDKSPPFPAVTLCNLRPLSNVGRDLLRRNSWKTPREFATSVNNYAARAYYARNQTHKYMLMTQSINMAAYLESLPTTNNYSHMGHQLNQMIIRCMVERQENKHQIMSICDNVGTWIVQTHPLYLNCFTYTLLEQYRNATQTLLMFIYLNEPFSEVFLCDDCFLNELKSQLSGALILVHNSEELPEINQNSVHLQPGTLTEFRLKIIEKRNKSPPYGKCSVDTPRTIHLNNRTYVFSEFACRSRKIQQDINANCECSAIEHPILNFSLPFCSSLPEFINASSCNDPIKNQQKCIRNMELNMAKAKCKIRVQSKYHTDVIDNCTLPCKFYMYESDRSTSTWPSRSMQLHWMRAGHLNSFQESAPIVSNITELIREGSLRQANKLLLESKILNRNLLAVLINRPNKNVHIVEEKEVISLTSFLSQAGGLCSIWIGFTLISIVELIELVLNCCRICRIKGRCCFSSAYRLPSSTYSSTTCSSRLPPHDNVDLKQERQQQQQLPSIMAEVETDENEVCPCCGTTFLSNSQSIKKQRKQQHENRQAPWRSNRSDSESNHRVRCLKLSDVTLV